MIPLLLAFSLQLHSRGAVLSSFQAGDGAWQLGTIAVGNIDADAQAEIVVPYRNALGLWIVDAFKYNGQRVTGFPFNGLNFPINTSPTLYDLNGDGRFEIIFTHDSEVVALRGDGSVLWRSPVNSLNYVPTGGFMSTVGGFYWLPSEAFLPLLPATSMFYSEVSPPLVVDSNADGRLEVITAWKIDPSTVGTAQDYNPIVNDIFGGGEWGAHGEVWSGGVVHMDAQTGALGTIYHLHQLVEAGLASAQLDGDPAQEILVLNDADSVAAYDTTQPNGFLGNDQLHKQFGKNQRFLSGAYQTGVDVHAADIDGDGKDEVLVPSSRIDPNWEPMATILDDDGAIIWREWFPPLTHPRTHGWFNSATMIPINPDHDNRIDVLMFMHGAELDFRTWNGIELSSRPGWPKTFGQRLPCPPVVGDIDGDGQEEIITATYNPAKNPSDGELLIFSLAGQVEHSEPIPGGVKHIPAIADVNADGSPDLVFRSMAGRLYIMNFGATGNSPVSWATHRGDMQRSGRGLRALRSSTAPLITATKGARLQNHFTWNGLFTAATGFEVFRAISPNGAFTRLAALNAAAREFTDTNVEPGNLYTYEVVALYPSGPQRSAPTPILSDYTGNLLRNGGFEEDDDSHWDKWFSGDIPWANMRGSTVAHSGAQSMEIRLQNHGNNSSITQYSHYGTPDSYIPVTPGKFYSFGGFIKSTGLNAPSAHWFEWDSSKTGENTNNRPGLPWPNYFTPALEAGTNTTPWTYANRVFQMPNGFPNVQLRHRFTTESPVTGSIYLDDLFFRELPAPEDAARWTNLLPFGSTWRYNTNAPSGWTAETFNDTTWKSAPAKFGAGVAQNVRTALPSKIPYYYFRTTFQLPFSISGSLSDLLLSATATDEYGGKVYPFRLFLNGQEALTTGIEAVSGEGNIVKHYDLTPFLPLLKPGANTIAVQLPNVWQPTWDNVAFDLRLQGFAASDTPPAATAPRFTSVKRLANGTIELTITGSPNRSWTLQSSNRNNPFNWETVQTITIPASAVVTMIDTGQNGRTSPANTPRRYYRLIQP
ncbi:MAG TPA: hypothetical protein VEH27_02515 [Methylomirabilota bacterium]|nr:hypothetical protein [Methylomirabilota bacterium]